MSRIRCTDRSVAGALAAGLVVLIAVHLASGQSGSSLMTTVHGQTDITAGRNLAAAYQCVVALAAALLCIRIASKTSSGWSRIGWLAIASGLTMTCILEFIESPGSLRAIPLIVALASVPFIVFVYRHSRHLPEARLLLAVLFILMLSNPITDGIERHITSNDANYTFVATNEPYAFSADAWTRLRFVSTVQEISEVLAVIVVVAIAEALLSNPTARATRPEKPSATAEHG